MADQGAIGVTGAGFSTSQIGVGGYCAKFPGLWQSVGIDSKKTVSMSNAVKMHTVPSVPQLYTSVTQHGAGFGVNGVVSGQFLDASAQPIAGAKVAIYRRSSCEMVARTITDSQGNYSFGRLAYDSATLAADCFVVFFDPAGGTLYNDVIVSQFTMGP